MNPIFTPPRESSKIEWLVDSHIMVGSHKVSHDPTIKDGHSQGSGVKRDSRSKRLVKRLAWPAFRLRSQLFTDGFIEREVGKLIHRYLTDDAIFLEVGCGQIDLVSAVPPHLWYNALDLELSEFHVRRHMDTNPHINLVLASAAQIPCADNSASLIVSTETLEHIPEITETLCELYRVARPDATLICSIPNNYCYKYVKKGPHAGHINDWGYEEFIEVMRERGFELIEGFMRGVWIPLPTWVTSTSYQIGVSAREEHYNTNFFYVFKARK